MIVRSAALADLVEQRLQRAHVVGAGRDVEALVAAEAAHHRVGVVAERAGVDLQHQAVVEAHARHLGQHVAAEAVGLLGARPGRRARGGTAPRPRLARQVLGAGGRVAVVAAGGAVRLEEGAAVAVRLEVAVPVAGVAAGDLAEPGDVGGEAGELRVDHRVRAVGGDDAAAPARVADHRVPAQVVERALGGGDHLDAEAVEQRARPELRAGEAVGDMVVVVVGGLGREPPVEAEHRLERVVEPEPRRRAAQQVVVLGEAAPDRAAVGLGRAAVGARHAEVGERHALRVQHAEDVVVGGDEELRRVGKRLRPRRTSAGRCGRAG